jgi:hypothetical protein
MKRLLVALAVLGVLLPIAIAQADPVQEFSFQLKDVKKDGRFTVVFQSRSYDTSGGQPPALSSNYLRIPVGAKFNSAFLNKRYYCDADKLLKDLQAAPETNRPFYKRVENLKATLKRIKSRLSKSSIKNVEVCAGAEVGRGSVDVDARPLFNDLIPAKIYLYFSKGTEKGALASFGILGIPDETAQIVKDNPIIANTRVVAHTNWFNDPTPDGLYGYKLVLPVAPVAGLRITISRVDVTTKGLTQIKKKKTCIKKRHGKCVKKKVKKTFKFWFTPPTCPPSGQLSFQAFYAYETGLESTKTIQLSCPKFSG